MIKTELPRKRKKSRKYQLSEVKLQKGSLSGNSRNIESTRAPLIRECDVADSSSFMGSNMATRVAAYTTNNIINFRGDASAVRSLAD